MAYLTIGKMNGVGKLQKNTPVVQGAGSMDNYVDVIGGIFGELTKDSGIRALVAGQIDWENRWTFKCYFSIALAAELRQSSRWIINGRIFSINSYEKIGEKNFNYRFSLTEKETVLPFPPDADSTAFYNESGITDETQKDSVDVMVKSFKDEDLWTGDDAIWPFMGGTAFTHKWNLRNTALYQLSYNGAALHSTNGYKPNGTTEYAITGLIPSAVPGADQNAGHMSFYARDIGAGSGQGEMGSYDAFRMTRFIINAGGNAYGELNSAAGSGLPVSGTELGFFMLVRTASGQTKLYRNGILYLTFPHVSNGLSTVAIFIGAINTNGSPAGFGNRQCAFASYGKVGYNDAQALSYYNIVQAFQTSNNRQV